MIMKLLKMTYRHTFLALIMTYQLIRKRRSFCQDYQPFKVIIVFQGTIKCFVHRLESVRRMGWKGNHDNPMVCGIVYGIQALMASMAIKQ